MNPYASNSKSFQALNPHLFPMVGPQKPQPADSPKPMTRHRPVLNKTEAAYLERLKGIGYGHIYVQDITLRLGDDCRYTPDFVTVDVFGLVTAHEVKGFMRDDARVKLHVAARLYPWISFVLARRFEAGWNVVPVEH